VVDTRTCRQCGIAFTPRREHARFCSVRCRVAWNRENIGDLPVEVSALKWSVTAMSDSTDLLPRLKVSDRARAFAAIGEAVWCVTVVDATLVRRHAGAYDAVMAGQTPVERWVVEGVLAGLRFVRNRIGHEVDLVEFIDPSAPGAAAGKAHVTGWTWKSVPEPVLQSLPARAQRWEMTRYRAYQAQLAGHTIGEIFERSAAFLKLTAATAITDISAHAAP
jgi:hypothetical protein